MAIKAKVRDFEHLLDEVLKEQFEPVPTEPRKFCGLECG